MLPDHRSVHSVTALVQRVNKRNLSVRSVMVTDMLFSSTVWVQVWYSRPLVSVLGVTVRVMPPNRKTRVRVVMAKVIVVSLRKLR